MGVLKKNKLENFNVYFALAIGLLITSRLLTFIAFPNPTAAPDSPTYFAGKFLDFSLVSFSGGASRGWPVPFVYAFMPNLEILELFQLILSAIAWSFLLSTIYIAKLIPTKQNNYLILLIALLGSSSQIIQHDTSVLATSITNSIFILLIAFLLKAKYVMKSQKRNLIAALSCTALLMIQKTSFIPIAIALSLLLFYIVFKHLSTLTRVASFSILICLTLYAAFVGSNVNSNWQISYSGQTLLWHLGGQSPSAAEFSAYLKKRKAPTCLTIEAPYQNINTSIGKILNSCPEARPYLKKEIQRDFANFIISNPTEAAKLSIYGIGAALTSSATNYGSAVSVVPKFVDDIFFGSTTPDIRSQNVSDQVSGLNVFKSGAAFWLSVPFVGWFLLMMVSSLLRGRERKDDSVLYWILAFCLIQSVLVVILLPSEWVRQTAPFLISALVSTVVLTFKNITAVFSKVTKSGK